MKPALVLLLVGAALSFWADDSVGVWIAAHQMPGWLAVAKMVSRFLAWPWLMLGCAVCLTLCWWQKKTKAVHAILFAMICASAAGLMADFTRGATGRTRPNSGFEQSWNGPRKNGRWLLADARFQSFPSGHTAVAAGLVAALLLKQRRAGIALLPLPLVVGAARLYVGAHYFSDVTCAAAIGLATAFAADYSSKVPIARRPFALASKTSRLTG